MTIGRTIERVDVLYTWVVLPRLKRRLFVRRQIDNNLGRPNETRVDYALSALAGRILAQMCCTLKIYKAAIRERLARTG